MDQTRFTHFTSGVTVAPPRAGVPIAFARALQARVDYATAMFANDEGDVRQALLKRAREEAKDLAWDLVMIGEADLPCPHLFADVPTLREAFEDSVNWAQLERAELDEELASIQAEIDDEKAKAERHAAIEAAIAAGAWAALGLPTPEQFLQTLADGESVDVHGHTFDYVSDEGVWVTNPYGVDGLVSMDPMTVTDARRVLAYLARGSTYGPVPPGSE